MKDTLLITLGDSWTHGVGCYDPDALARFKNKEIDQGQLYSASYGRFYQYSWAQTAAKELDADLLNLAVGGDANGAQVRRLLEYNDRAIWTGRQKIVLVFMLSTPARFAFYRDGEPVSVFPPKVSHQAQDLERLAMAYYLAAPKAEDQARETAFYCRVVDEWCMFREIPFVIGSAFTPSHEITDLFPEEQAPLSIFSGNYITCAAKLLDSKAWYAHCGHPNEFGYATIGKYVAYRLKEMKVLDMF